MTERWKFFATRLHGNGTETMLVEDLPLAEPEIEDVLSSPGTIRGKIEPEHAALQTSDGSPILRPWSTALYAERNGQIAAGGILQPGSEVPSGTSLTLEAAGFTHYPYQMPYDGMKYFVETDALDIYRHIWAHLQGMPGGNLGLVLDGTKAGVLVGEELEEVTFETGAGEEVMFEAGPFKLAWWLTDDLSQRLADLGELAKFETREEHSWKAGGGIQHRLRFGVPRLGRRRHDMHFKVGDNLLKMPTLTPTEYASEVWALGAGEGRTMKHGRASRSSEPRLRRVAVVTEKQTSSHKRAAELAARELAARTGDPVPTSITIRRTEDGLPDVGDEIFLMHGGTGWVGEDKVWVRIISRTIKPYSQDVTCEVVRAQ